MPRSPASASLRAGVDGVSEQLISRRCILTVVAREGSNHAACKNEVNMVTSSHVLCIHGMIIPKTMFINGIVTPVPNEVTNASERSSLSSHVEKLKIRW